MGKLFRRAWRVTVGDVDISELKCEFNVKKTLKPEPNTATLKIWNLNKDHRKAFSNPKGVKIRIEAGYDSGVSQIYLGDVRTMQPGEWQGADVITELSSADGEKNVQLARLSIPVGAKAPLADVLRNVVKALGVGQGNIAKATAALAAKGVTPFPRPTVINDSAASALTDLCRAGGLEWSIQDGALQLLDLGKALDSFPYILSSNSGMIGGSPKVSNDGKLSVETLMLPDLRPGMRVQVDAEEVKGLYRILETHCTGETHGNRWGFKLVCEASKVKL